MLINSKHLMLFFLCLIFSQNTFAKSKHYRPWFGSGGKVENLKIIILFDDEKLKIDSVKKYHLLTFVSSLVKNKDLRISIEGEKTEDSKKRIKKVKAYMIDELKAPKRKIFEVLSDDLDEGVKSSISKSSGVVHVVLRNNNEMKDNSIKASKVLILKDDKIKKNLRVPAHVRLKFSFVYNQSEFDQSLESSTYGAYLGFESNKDNIFGLTGESRFLFFLDSVINNEYEIFLGYKADYSFISGSTQVYFKNNFFKNGESQGLSYKDYGLSQKILLKLINKKHVVLGLGGFLDLSLGSSFKNTNRNNIYVYGLEASISHSEVYLSFIL